MRRAICCLFVSAFAFLVVAVNLAVGEQSAGRTLTRVELEGAYGGGAHECCMLPVVNDCGATGTSCASKTMQIMCVGFTQIQIFQGNQKFCVATVEDLDCTAGEFYMCREDKTCIWTGTQCIAGTQSGTDSAPLTCTPNCP